MNSEDMNGGKPSAGKLLLRNIMRVLLGNPPVLILILVIIVGLIAYAVYSADYQMKEIMRMYMALSQKRTDSKSGFDKKLFYVTIDENGNQTIHVGYSSEEAEAEAQKELENSGGGSAKPPTTQGPSTSIKDANVSKNGSSTSMTITVGGSSVPLYNGIPESWGASDNSVYIDFGEVKNAWKEGYNTAFGHYYPNSILDNGWHSDDTVNRYSTAGGQSGPTFNYPGDSVVCVGFAPTQYYADCIFRWGGVGEASNCYNYKWVIVVKNSNGDIGYLPAICSDAKAHTWPGGACQTYISHKDDTSVFAMPRGGKSDTATTLDSSELSTALGYLEDGTAGNGYGSTKSNVVQFSVEGYGFGDINNQGWTAIGVVRVQ